MLWCLKMWFSDDLKSENGYYGTVWLFSCYYIVIALITSYDFSYG